MFSFIDFIKEEFKLTLKYHGNLNPKIWKGGKLDPTLSVAIKVKAYEFAHFSGINRGKIKDIVFTGSNANFNYTRYSDIDIHIITDESGLDPNVLYDKKVDWTLKHPNLKVAGYPIEFFAQDKNEHFPEGQGVYSIVQRSWLNQPKHLQDISVLKDPKVIDKVKFYIRYIRTELLGPNGTADMINAFKSKMQKARTAGLQTNGEFSIENIIYKDLRNRGLIDKLNAKLHKM